MIKYLLSFLQRSKRKPQRLCFIKTVYAKRFVKRARANAKCEDLTLARWGRYVYCYLSDREIAKIIKLEFKNVSQKEIVAHKQEV